MIKRILTIVIIIICLKVYAYAGDTPISPTPAQDQIKKIEGRIGLNIIELTIQERLGRIEMQLPEKITHSK